MEVDVESAIRDAERCVRRGELKEAVLLYERAVAARPQDRRLRSRLASVRALLTPSERTALQGCQPPAPAVVTTQEEEAERLADRGCYGEAAAIYARVLERRPDSPLLFERYQELLALSRQARAPATPRSSAPADREAALRALLDRLTQNRR